MTDSHDTVRLLPTLEERLRARPESVSAPRAEPPPAAPPRRRKPPVLKRLRQWFRAIRRARLGAERLEALEVQVRHLAGRMEHDQRQMASSLDACRNDLDKLSSGVVKDLVERFAGATEDALHRDIESRFAVLQQAGTDLVEQRVGTTETALRRDIESRLAALQRASADDRALLLRAYGDLGRRLDLLRHGRAAPPPAPPDFDGVDMLLDSFYNRLEGRCRGSREEIERRVSIYLPDAVAAQGATGKPVLDLGCGRGEWLAALKRRGIPGEGVDLNPVQVAEAREAGIEAREGDACATLAAAPSESYGMITAFHVIEHMPFRTVTWIVREALRVLAPGGILLVETPHAGNLLVGGSSFHIDPTHIRPLPRALLEVLYETVGFHPVEARLLHPAAQYESELARGVLGADLTGLLFGPEDLAVLGVKPPLP